MDNGKITIILIVCFVLSLFGFIMSFDEEEKILPHMYGLCNEPFDLSLIDTWYNITFNSTISIIEGNLNFENEKTLIIKEKGDYLIDFGVEIMDSSTSPNAQVAIRIVKNRVQLLGSYVEVTTTKQNAEQFLQKLTYAELEVGDRLEMQVISSDGDVSVKGLNTYNTGVNAIAFGYIEKIH